VKRNVWIIVGIAVISTAALYFFCNEKLWCTYIDVDTNSGRMRSRVYRMHLLASETIEETRVSRLVPVELRGTNGAWKIDTMHSPFVRSPHYQFHGTIADFNRFLKLLDMYSVEDAKRKHLASTALTHLRRDLADFRNYIQKLENTVVKNDSGN